MALTSHQTRVSLYAPEAELAPNASPTTDKPISHLHYTEGVCGGAVGGAHWSKRATFRTNAGSEECSLDKTDGGQDSNDQALKTFLLTAVVWYFC